MYFIGPLLFCACAEMTCCFFILCVPCILAVMKQTRLAFKAKRFLGFSHKADQKASDPNHPRSTHGLRRPNLESADLDEVEGKYSEVPLRRLEASESQEQLRPSRGKSAMYVTRTTHIDVCSHKNSADPEQVLKKKVIPWDK